MNAQFNNLFEEQKAMFVYSKGQERFEKIYNTILNCKMLGKLGELSIRGGAVPTAQDFATVVTSNWSIALKFDQATNTIASLIALQIWDKLYNQVYHIDSEERVYAIALAIVRYNNRRL